MTTESTHRPITHDSAQLHVSGQAEYTDDIPEPAGCLHAAICGSPVAHGRLNGLALDEITAADAVVDIITSNDIPGGNDISPAGLNDEPVFATGNVSYHGQPLFAVLATDRESARRAAHKAKPDITAAEPLIAIDDVVNAATGAAHPSAFVTSPLLSLIHI